MADEPRDEGGGLRIAYEGVEYEVDPDDLTLQEGHEAEVLLDLDVTEAKGMGLMMLVLFVGMRREQPDRDPHIVAEEAKTAKIVKLDFPEDAKVEVEGDPPTGAETGRPRLVEASGSETTPEEPGEATTARSSA